MAVNTAAGSTFSIGPQTAYATTVDWSEPEEDIIAAFEALTWTKIGSVEDLGEFGDEASEITFSSLDDRRVQKFKGTFDAGTVTVQTGSDPTDAGQLAMIEAFATDFDYPFRVTLNDALTVGGTPTTLYFAGKVMSKRRNVGDVENVVRQSFPVGINTEIIEVPAT